MQRYQWDVSVGKGMFCQANSDLSSIPTLTQWKESSESGTALWPPQQSDGMTLTHTKNKVINKWEALKRYYIRRDYIHDQTINWLLATTYQKKCTHVRSIRDHWVHTETFTIPRTNDTECQQRLEVQVIFLMDMQVCTTTEQTEHILYDPTALLWV